MGLLDALKIRTDNLPATFYFFANDVGPIGQISAEGNSVLLLFKTRQDAEEAKVGLGITGDLYDVGTLTKLAALFGTADNLGYWGGSRLMLLLPRDNRYTRWRWVNGSR